MKAIVKAIFFSILFHSLFAGAFVVESGYLQQDDGQYIKATKVTCDGGTKQYCQALCQNGSSCQRIEPYCRNCAGTSSPLLRQLFTEISRFYKIKRELPDRAPLVQYLATEKYVLLDVKSVFNYYTPVGGESFLKELGALCGKQAETALLAVRLDQVNQPIELSYVLCRNNIGQTTAFEVEPRKPELGQQPLSTPLFFNLN
ncbi:MAG: hypothetical protein KUL82_12420 [Bdellovibrio sp.]|nr:hypothetical protein [Bdellovibrio sp.]